MPIWSWIVIPTLWTISICLAGFSISFILKGVRYLKRAKWSEFADRYEEMLNSSQKMGIKYEKMIEEYDKMISGVKELLDKKEPIHSNLSKKMREYYTSLVDVTKGYEETLEAQIDILKQIKELTEKGGLPGFSTLSQIEATKNIAIAAVLMAFSSIGFSISSGILSVVK